MVHCASHGRSGRDPFRRRRLLRVHDQRRHDHRRRRHGRRRRTPQLSLTNDTTLGIMRYADAGYEAALDEVAKQKIMRIVTE